MSEKRVSPWLWILTGATLVAVLAVTALLMVRLQASTNETPHVPSAHTDGG